MELDDLQIMQRVLNGEIHLFDEFVARYRVPLLRVAQSKLGDPQDAEDAVQETFLAAYSARTTFDPRYSFRTWLWTILLNRCRRKWQRSRRRPAQLPTSFLSQDPGSAAALVPVVQDMALDQVVLAEEKEQLLALLDLLPDVQADALRLRFFGGLKFEEIAQSMGCSLGGAKMRVKNGLQTLAKHVRQREGEPE